ncbi:MAG TPA: hypothetical protein VI233_13640 [Puia sp.]
MNIPSSFNLSAIPEIDELKKLCKSISALDAIICPEWEYRYYSYQSDWDADMGEECMEMRNGSGDHFFVLFSPHGAIINGQAHESEMSRSGIWPGVVDRVPAEFHHFIFGEPIKSIGTTFCIWRKYTDSKWEKGDFVYPEDELKDGSEDLLFILDNVPETYQKFALDYYEDEFENDVNRLGIDVIRYIYAHKPITREIALKINPHIGDFEKLKQDLAEIGYPGLL